jgi:hypothetical protein
VVGVHKLFDSERLEKHPDEQTCPVSKLIPLASACCGIDEANGGHPACVKNQHETETNSRSA